MSIFVEFRLFIPLLISEKLGSAEQEHDVVVTVALVVLLSGTVEMTWLSL